MARGINPNGPIPVSRGEQALTSCLWKKRNDNQPDGVALFLQVRGNARSWFLVFTRQGVRTGEPLGSLADMGLREARREAKERLAVGARPPL